MDVFAPNGSAPETEAKLCTGMRRRHIRGRFRATLAGLLELEVLRVRHKEMVEAALEKHESPDGLDDLELQPGQYQYWLEESSFRLKLKRSLSHENVVEAKESRSLKMACSHHSTEHLQKRYVHERRSRASSGFYECTDNDAISSLSTSLASLSYQSNDDAGYFDDAREWPVLLKGQKYQKSRMEAQAFSKVVIPDAGFLSVIDLYPDSHWPDISDILQPQVILEPSYRSDLRSLHGSGVYRYPSPLHAVALQSPLYAPQVQTKYESKNGRCSAGISASKSSSFPRPDSVRTRRTFESPSMLRSNISLTRSENCRCEENVLKRAQGKPWSHTTAKTTAGVHQWPKRSMASIYRTCSMGKTRALFKSTPSPNRATEALEPAVSSAVPPAGFRGSLGSHKNRLRRHTAALTNLNMFMGSSGTLCAFTERNCSVCAPEMESPCHGQSSEVCLRHK